MFTVRKSETFFNTFKFIVQNSFHIIHQLSCKANRHLTTLTHTSFLNHSLSHHFTPCISSSSSLHTTTLLVSSSSSHTTSSHLSHHLTPMLTSNSHSPHLKLHYISPPLLPPNITLTPSHPHPSQLPTRPPPPPHTLFILLASFSSPTSFQSPSRPHYTVANIVNFRAGGGRVFL